MDNKKKEGVDADENPLNLFNDMPDEVKKIDNPLNVFNEMADEVEKIMSKLKGKELLEGETQAGLISAIDGAVILFEEALKKFETEHSDKKEDIKAIENAILEIKDFRRHFRGHPVESTKTLLDHIKGCFHTLSDVAQRFIINPIVSFFKAIVTAIAKAFKVTGQQLGFFKQQPELTEAEKKEQQQAIMGKEDRNVAPSPGGSDK